MYDASYNYKILNTDNIAAVKTISRGEIIMTERHIKRDINDIGTWAYPNIKSGVTVVRKENVTENEIYDIYKDCIDIQRNAYICLIKRRGDKYQT